MYHILSNRNGVLYFRYMVPVAVKKYFPRLQSSYNRSLRTAYRQEAKIRAVFLYADIHTRLENAMKLVNEFREKIRIMEEFAPHLDPDTIITSGCLCWVFTPAVE